MCGWKITHIYYNLYLKIIIIIIYVFYLRTGCSPFLNILIIALCNNSFQVAINWTMDCWLSREWTWRVYSGHVQFWRGYRSNQRNLAAGGQDGSRHSGAKLPTETRAAAMKNALARRGYRILHSSCYRCANHASSSLTPCRIEVTFVDGSKVSVIIGTPTVHRG